MSHAFSANLFTLCAGTVTLFQLALVAGAPWGQLTQGGRVGGALPLAGRLVALASALLLVAFIVAVRARARTDRFRRMAWVVVAYCALGIVANAATPSAPERALWLPVVTLMFGASLHVARRRAPTRDVP
ncbi:hypothetical protein Strain138_002207 [Pseudogemmatithrix spongiicola]|uniref:Uncharacterized protein n=1 Tax=Pseudogemmatithrix spongiicola TaxID=3062599 RepID=A0AA49Q5K8_9BACT|nr:hypothetical protein Strain138_002207 [Gemmatimonadaceae bacterium 'strain 138']WKW15803.1 hypothetical protein Strain318_002206 [Gemmatimonadaceae bacterium 'strain 318']